MRLGEILWEIHAQDHAPGTRERGWLLLRLIARSLPIPVLTEAYFDNLARLLADRPQRQPGRIAFGIGPGRCGSTSLTALAATIPDSCCTHENPAIVFWQPLATQIEFHIRRLTMLAARFSLVLDAAHWWINLAESLLARFPDTVFIGLRRQDEACVRSFFAIKGGKLNHWAPPGNGIWRPHAWDPAYPSYPVTDAGDPGGSMQAAIARYVADYHRSMEQLAEQHPSRVLLLSTETLGDEAIHAKLFDFLGARGRSVSYRLNASTISDGADDRLRL